MELCCVSSPFPSGIRDFLESVVLVVCQFGVSVVDPCPVMKGFPPGQRGSLWAGMVCGTFPSWHPLTKTTFSCSWRTLSEALSTLKGFIEGDLFCSALMT